MTRTQRLRWFNALGREDLEYLAAYHYVCMRTRLRQRRDESGSPG